MDEDPWAARTKRRSGSSSGQKTEKTKFRNTCGTRRSRLFFDYNFEDWCAFFVRIQVNRRFIHCGRDWRLRNRPRNWHRNLGIFEQPGGLAMSEATEAPACNGTILTAGRPPRLSPLRVCDGTGLTTMPIGFPTIFLATIAENFRRDGTIREKYNVVTRSSESGVRTRDISRT